MALARPRAALTYEGEREMVARALAYFGTEDR